MANEIKWYDQIPHPTPAEFELMLAAYRQDVEAELAKIATQDMPPDMAA